MFTNSQILSAVISKWAQPILLQLASSKMRNFTAIQFLDNKIRSTGWVSPNYSIADEISQFIEPATQYMVAPYIAKYLSNIPEEAIPNMAHAIIDKAITNGKVELFEGKIVFEESDLRNLKTLLNYNLPIKMSEQYNVITSPIKE